MKNVKLLDGGMGREIKKNLRNFDPVLWSASALIEAPDLVIKTHRKFIDAGSDIITTNNYTCVPYVLKQKNILDQFEFLSKKAGELARKSAECYRQKKN